MRKRFRNMETVQPILKRGRDVWDQINMPKSEFLRRVERIREEMRKEGMDVLLLYGAGVYDCGNVCYVSNYATKMTAGALAVLPKKGDLTLFFEGSSRELKIGQKLTWVDDIRSSLAGVFSSTGSLAGDCVKYLQESHLIPSKIGLVGLRDLMPYGEFQRLIEGAKGCKFVDADHIIRNMRMKKSTRECDQIRRASRIVSNALSTIPSMVWANRDERTMEAKIDWAARLQGAEDVRVLLGRPKQPDWALNPAGDTPISPGDSVIVYLAASFERYYAEGVRTFIAGNSGFSEVKDEKINEPYQKIMAAVKPGKSASQFFKETMNELRRKDVKYIPDYGLGHGIGLSLKELPFLDEKDTTQFPEGMCLVLRIGIRDQERGAIMTGNTLCLSEAGTEILTT
jgi:Xaa-Pro aminopeptidase